MHEGWLCDFLTLFHFYAMNYCRMYLSIILEYALCVQSNVEKKNICRRLGVER